MSKSIEEKVISMQFDNKNFETNIKTSMNSLEKLKQSLNFSNAAKSFDELTKASDKVSFKGIEKSMDKLESYMSLKTMAIFTVVNNMVTKIQTSFENMVKTFTVEPIKTGFNEYELKMGSVQTIMAATGADLKTVNGYLQELNLYADKTIYSFSDMTNNIGKFTNAGVKLEDAVLAIKGISNEAALSGANAQEASRAMYNLAQSISMGYVQLIDWKSIENANMATKGFKENLAGVAMEMGIIKKTGDDIYSVGGKSYNLQQLFKDGLKDQWLTTDVLIKTLSNYADETTEIGQKAYAAAQDIKTFTMMMDTLKEAAQSGWSETWELIVGDFEQAKKFFTYFGEIFGNIIDAASDARNAMVRSSMESYWDKITNKLKDAGVNTEAFEKGMTDMLRSHGVNIDAMIEKYGSLGAAIQHLQGWTKEIKQYAVEVLGKLTGGIDEVNGVVAGASNNLEHFQDIVNRVIRGEFGSGKKRMEEMAKAGENYAVAQNLVNQVWERNGHTWKDTQITQEMLIKAMGDMSDQELVALGIEEDQIDAARELIRQLQNGEGEFNELFNSVNKLRGRDLLFQSLKNVVTAVTQRFRALKEAWAEVFPPGSETILDKINNMFNALSVRLLWSGERGEKMKSIFKGIFSIFGLIYDVVKAFVTVLFPPLDKAVGKTTGGLIDILAIVGEAIFKFREFLHEGNFLIPMAQAVVDFVKGAIETLKEFVMWLWNLDAVQNVVAKLTGYFQGVVQFWKGIWDSFLRDVSDENIGFAGAIKNALKSIGQAIRSFIKNVPLLNTAFEFITSIPEKLSEAGMWSVQGFFQGIWNGIKEVPRVMKEFAMTVYNTFCDFLDIDSPSKVFMKAGEWIVKGLVEGIKNFAGLINKTASRVVTGLVNLLTDKSKDAEGEFKKKAGLLDVLRIIINKIREAFDKLVEYLRPVLDKVKQFISEFVDALVHLPWGKILLGLYLIFKLILQYKIVDAMHNFSKGAKNAGKGLLEFAKGVKKLGAALKITSLAIAILAFAAAIAVLVFVAHLLSKSDADFTNALEVVTTIGLMMAIVTGVFGAIVAFGGDKIVKALEAVSHILFGLAAVAVAAAASILIIMYAFDKLIDMTNTGEKEEAFYNALEAMKSILLVFASFITWVMAIGGIIDKLTGGSSGTTLLGLAASVLSLCLAISLIIRIIRKYLMTEDENGVLQFDPQKAKAIQDGFDALKWIIVTMTACLSAIAVAGRGGSSVKGLALTILAMSFSLYIIIGAMSYYAVLAKDIDNIQDSYWIVMSFLLAMGAMIALIGASFKDVDVKGIKAVKGVILAFGISLVGLIASLWLIKDAALDENTFNAVVSVCIAMLSGIFEILAFAYLVIQNGNFDAKDFSKIMEQVRTSVLVLAFAMMGIIGVLWLLDGNEISEQTFNAIVASVAALLGGLLEIMIIILATKEYDEDKISSILKSLDGFVGTLTLFIGATYAGLYFLNEHTMSEQTVAAICSALGTLILSLVGVIITILKTKDYDQDKVDSIVESLCKFVATMAGSFMVAMVSLMILDNNKISGQTLAAICTYLGAFFASLVAMLVFVYKAAKNDDIDADDVGSMLEAIQNAMLVFASSFAIMCLALKIVDGASISGTVLTAVIISAVALLGVVGEIMGLILGLGDKIKDMDMDKVQKMLLMIDTVMLAFSGSFGIMCYSLTLMNDVSLSPSALASAIISMVALLLVVGEMLGLIIPLSKQDIKAKSISAVLGMIDSIMAVFAVAFHIMGMTIKSMSESRITEGAMISALGIVIALGVLVFKMIDFVSRFVLSSKKADLAVAVAMIDSVLIAFALAFHVIGQTVKNMTASGQNITLESIFMVVVILGGLCIAMAEIMTYLKQYHMSSWKDLVGGVGGLVIAMGVLTWAFIQIAECCENVRNFNVKEYWSIIGGMVAMIIVLGVAIYGLSQLNAQGLFGAGEIIAIAAAVWILAQALKSFDGMNTDVIWAAAGALIAVGVAITFVAGALTAVLALIGGSQGGFVGDIGIAAIIAAFSSLFVAAAILAAGLAELTKALAENEEQLYRWMIIMMGSSSMFNPALSAEDKAAINERFREVMDYYQKAATDTDNKIKKTKKVSGNVVATGVTPGRSAAAKSKIKAAARKLGENDGKTTAKEYNKGLTKGMYGAGAGVGVGLPGGFDAVKQAFGQTGIDGIKDTLTDDNLLGSLGNAGETIGNIWNMETTQGIVEGFMSGEGFDLKETLGNALSDSGMLGDLGNFDLSSVFGEGGFNLDFTNMFAGSFDIQKIFGDTLGGMNFGNLNIGNIFGQTIDSGKSNKSAKEQLADELAKKFKFRPEDYHRLGIIDERDLHYVYEDMAQKIIDGGPDGINGALRNIHNFQWDTKNRGAIKELVWQELWPTSMRFEIDKYEFLEKVDDAIKQCTDALQQKVDAGETGESVWQAASPSANVNAVLSNQTELEMPDIVQTNDAATQLAINGLKDDITSLGNKIASLSIQLDTGLLVGQLAPRINTELGNYANYANRGNFGYVGAR